LRVHPQVVVEVVVPVGGLGRLECIFDSEFATAGRDAELTRRRVDDDDERALWAFDAWDSAAAEVGAAMAVGSRRASKEMRIAQALRDRLPAVAGLACKGALSSRLVSAITWGTRLVEDAEAVAMIDAAIAERASHWELRDAVDVQVARYDPDALRRTQNGHPGSGFRRRRRRRRHRNHLGVGPATRARRCCPAAAGRRHDHRALRR
jgi:hypothetical protein